jgi:O-antigen ligase
MTALPAPSLRAAGTGARLAAGALILGLLAAGMAHALAAGGPSPKLAVAGGLAMVSMLLLAIARYDLAVAVGFLLMAVVRIEPAPPDGAFAVIMAVAAATGRFRLSRAPRLVVALVGALIAINLLSAMDAIDTGAALRFFGITAYLAFFSLWLAGYLDSSHRARLIVRVWLFVAILSALAGIAAYFLPVPGKEILLGDGVTRARALFKDPNVYGPFLVPIAVVLLEQRLNPRLLNLRASTTVLLFGILALGVLVSFSRAAWGNFLIATLITLVVASARRRGGRRAFRMLLALLLVGAMVGSVIGATGSVGFVNQRARVQSYDTDRFGAQRFGYELGWSHPVGVGPGQFIFHHPVEAHSTYIRVLAEQGFGGLLIWIGLVLTTLLLALRNAVRGRDSYGIGSAALLGAWCGLIFNSAVVDTLHWRHLWVVAALIWAGAMMPRARALGRQRAA